MTDKFMLGRRKIIAGATAGAAALAAPAIAQTRPKITVQCFGGLFEKTMREAILPLMEKEHNTEVTLAVEDDTTLLPKLRAARGRAPFDVVTVDNNIAILGQEMDLWAPDQQAQMPHAKDVYRSSMPPVTSNYGSVVYEYALVHNTNKLPAPTSWMELWNDGITAGVPHVAQSYGLTFLFMASVMHGGSAENLDPGFAAIKKLKKFRIYKNVSEGLNLFQQGEVDAALFYSHRGQQMINMGLPIRRSSPKEGTYGQRTGSQIPKNASNLEGARAFVNLTLRPDVQLAFAQHLYSPTNSKTMLPPDLARQHVYGAQHVDSIREAPWDKLLPQRDRLLERWTREFG